MTITQCLKTILKPLFQNRLLHHLSVAIIEGAAFNQVNMAYY